jgi:hypothetical protein
MTVVSGRGRNTPDGKARAVAALAARGRALSEELEKTDQPAKMQALAREIEATSMALRKEVHAEVALRATAVLRAEGHVEPGEPSDTPRSAAQNLKLEVVLDTDVLDTLPKTVDLMAALRESLERAKTRRTEEQRSEGLGAAELTPRDE